jgi:hypothetical protein
MPVLRDMKALGAAAAAELEGYAAMASPVYRVLTIVIRTGTTADLPSSALLANA